MTVAMIRLACMALVLAVSPVSAATLAIVHAHLFTMGPAGEIKNGVIVIRDGRIAAVGTAIEVPAGAQLMDAQGRIVTPGLIATVTPLALMDLINRKATDGSQTDNAQMSAAFDVQYSVNPVSALIGEARVEGVTAAIVAPLSAGATGPASGTAHIFAGHAAAVRLGEGQSWLLKAHVAMSVAAGEAGSLRVGGARGAELVLLREMIGDVRLYLRNKAAYQANRLRPLLLPHLDLQALVTVVEGREPLLVSVDRASDILNVLAWAREQNLKLVLVGAAEGWMVADAIRKAGVPVVIDPEQNLPSDFDSLHAVDDNGTRLHAAGVAVSYRPGIARLAFWVRTPRLVAGRTVSRGMPYSDALAAITINPAVAFGVDDTIGSLEPNKLADVVIWSGDPLETSTVADTVIIGGVVQSQSARNRALRDRYINTVRQ